MLEDIIRVGHTKPADLQREVVPVSPYPRINPQQQQQEGYEQPAADKKAQPNKRARRRFTSMRELIEQLKGQAQIARVDFNTAHQELIDQGLEIAEEQLLPQLLELKIPLESIEELIGQLRQQSATPNLGCGRELTSDVKLFPVFVAEMTEYLMRFEKLRLTLGTRQQQMVEEIASEGFFAQQNNRLHLKFSRSDSLPDGQDGPFELTISILVGAAEIDENGRRAIFYRRPDQSYGLYSDKSISLSI